MNCHQVKLDRALSKLPLLPASSWRTSVRLVMIAVVVSWRSSRLRMLLGRDFCNVKSLACKLFRCSTPRVIRWIICGINYPSMEISRLSFVEGFRVERNYSIIWSTHIIGIVQVDYCICAVRSVRCWLAATLVIVP